MEESPSYTSLSPRTGQCARHPGGRDPGAGRRLQRQPQALRGQLSATGAVPPSQSKRLRLPGQRKVSPGLHGAIPRHARAADARGGAGPALGVFRRHSPAADATGSPPSPQPDPARGSSPLPASPSANFANFPRGPAGRSGRPRASPRAPAPARAPPRPPRTYRSGPPRRTCPPAPAAARAASLLGAGLGREAPRRRGNRTRWRLRRAARGGAREPERQDRAKRDPCWIDAALRHGPGQGTYYVPRCGVSEHCPPAALLLRIPDQLPCSFH